MEQDGPDLVDDLQVAGVAASAVAYHLHEIISTPSHLVHGVLGCIGLLIPLHAYACPGQLQVNIQLMSNDRHAAESRLFELYCQDSFAMSAAEKASYDSQKDNSSWLHESTKLHSQSESCKQAPLLGTSMTSQKRQLCKQVVGPCKQAQDSSRDDLRELNQAPSQQGNAEGSWVGHLEVASRAPLQVPPCDVPVQGAQLVSQCIRPPCDWVVHRQGAHLLSVQVKVGVVHGILQLHTAAQKVS